MSDAKLLITLMVIFSCSAVNAQQSEDKGFEPIQEVGNFKAYMLDHPFKGCPTNSLCNKKMGALRSSWLAVLGKNKKFVALEKFRKKHGIPLNIWNRDTMLKHPRLIVWDSFCPKHNPKPSSEGLINTAEKIYISQAFYKDFNELKKSHKVGEEILLNNAYLLEENGKITNYIIPRAEAPLFISDKKLYFTIEEEGFYFGLWVASNGTVNVDQTFLPKHFPDEVKCPEPLAEAFKKGIVNPNLYQGFFCKALWNQTTKKYNTLAIGWSCN